MNVFLAVICSVYLFCIFPGIALSDVIVYDMIVLQGDEVMLRAETRGKFFSKGGEVVEFLVGGRSVGKALSGGDGFALKQFTPRRTGLHRVTVKSGVGEGNGVLLSLKKGTKIVFVDVEGSLLRGSFSSEPREGSQRVIKRINGSFPVVFLQTGITGIKAIKAWLKEHGFIEGPVVPWRQGAIFVDVHEKGLKIKAVVGGKAVIESAKGHKPLAFSFEGIEDAREVKDWEEIWKKLK